MSFDLVPFEHQEICPGMLVTKHPSVFSLEIQLSEVFGLSPILRFSGMSAFGIPDGFVDHPVIQRTEGSI